MLKARTNKQLTQINDFILIMLKIMKMQHNVEVPEHFGFAEI